MQVEYFDLNENNDKLMFVVVLTKFKDKWVFVRHQDRTTWEFPGGHIESGESTDEAAARELREESGADKFRITPVCNYGVNRDNKMSFGRVYFSEVSTFVNHLEYEIDEVKFSNELPENLTYDYIMKSLFSMISDRQRCERLL